MELGWQVCALACRLGPGEPAGVSREQADVHDTDLRRLFKALKPSVLVAVCLRPRDVPNAANNTEVIISTQRRPLSAVPMDRPNFKFRPSAPLGRRLRRSDLIALHTDQLGVRRVVCGILVQQPESGKTGLGISHRAVHFAQILFK